MLPSVSSSSCTFSLEYTEIKCVNLVATVTVAMVASPSHCFLNVRWISVPQKSRCLYSIFPFTYYYSNGNCIFSTELSRTLLHLFTIFIGTKCSHESFAEFHSVFNVQRYHNTILSLVLFGILVNACVMENAVCSFVDICNRCYHRHHNSRHSTLLTYIFPLKAFDSIVNCDGVREFKF